MQSIGALGVATQGERNEHEIQHHYYPENTTDTHRCCCRIRRVEGMELVA